MSPLVRGLLAGALQLLILLAIAGKYAYDRATLPRSWVAVHMVDPDSLLRGRYLVLQTVEPHPHRLELYIPEHARIKPGDDLWAEVSQTSEGPRPIRLAIRRDGQYTPLGR